MTERAETGKEQTAKEKKLELNTCSCFCARITGGCSVGHGHHCIVLVQERRR